MASLVPYNFPGSFPDDFLRQITGDGENEGELGWTTNYPDGDGNGFADFVDDYRCGHNPDLHVRVSQDHAGDGGHAGHHRKP